MGTDSKKKSKLIKEIKSATAKQVFKTAVLLGFLSMSVDHWNNDKLGSFLGGAAATLASTTWLMKTSDRKRELENELTKLM